MQTWKLLGLATCLAVAVGCGGVFKTDSPQPACPLVCAPEETCRWDAEGQARCEGELPPPPPDTPCRIGESCPPGEICLGLSGDIAGSPGVCRPGCRVGEADTCPHQHVCRGPESAPLGTLGECVAEAVPPVPPVPPGQPVAVSFSVSGRPLLGNTVQLCAHAPAGEALPPTLALSSLEVQAAGQGQALTWGLPQEVADARCWAVTLPFSLESGAAALAVEAHTPHPGGHTDTYAQQLALTLTRTECAHNVALEAGASGITAPLAFIRGGSFAGGRLAFGAGNHLYMFEPAACESGAAAVQSLQTGPVQGPMVVLGATAQVAVATWEGEGIETVLHSHLRLVDATTAVPQFAPNAAECVAQDVFIGAGFTQGLSLLVTDETPSPWRLAAPANDVLSPLGTYAGLVSYTPWGAAPCTPSTPSVSASRPFQTPVAQNADGEVQALCHYNQDGNLYQSSWVFNPDTPAWSVEELDGNFAQNAPTFMALAEDASGGYAAIGGGLQSAWVFVEPAQRYAVHSVGGGGYALRRHNLNTPTGYASPPFAGAPVGSPLLGQPADTGEGMEIYVVSVDGRVRAFDAQAQPLWTEVLVGAAGAPLAIAPKAQPVLVSNADGSGTLWVVSTQGHIRGLRVPRGLHLGADWPKALRDNCNTSSRQVDAGDMPTCF